MQTKYSSGPWFCSTTGFGWLSGRDKNGNPGYGIAQFKIPPSEADARLISAAPDILNSLKDLVSAIEQSKSGWDGIEIWRHDIYDAIARAEGRPEIGRRTKFDWELTNF